MANLSPYSYTDLFFVADAGISVGTVTVTGINDNLLGESGLVNEIFESGETWRFIVTNVLFPASVPPLLVFDSAGGFAGNSPGFPPGTASIPGTQLQPVPVPAAVWLFAADPGLMSWLHRKAAA